MTDDVEAIRRLLYAYADGVLERDADAWAATWADDATWVLGPGREVTGREAIVELWVSAMGRYASVVQLYQSNDVTFDGPDDAHGRAYLVELNEIDGQPPKMLAAYYLDVYRRTAEGWKFASRELKPLYAGPPSLEGGTFFGRHGEITRRG